MCADTPTTDLPDYKATLNLPKTDFPMRAGLPRREPEWLARWAEIGVYDRLREKEGREPFILRGQCIECRVNDLLRFPFLRGSNQR